MTFLKYHWFGFILSLAVLIYFVVFLLVLAAPRYNGSARGFGRCSAEMLEQAPTCGEGFSFCLLGLVVSNGWCNTAVVGEGIGKWIGGKQKTPWENYLYEPERQETLEELQPVYDENPELAKDMGEMIKQHKELEKKVLSND